jgi:spore coat protein U domain-containing protein, fimbrial subunit CupE1/2/3/6
MKRVRFMAILFLVSGVVRPAAANNCQVSATNIQFASYTGSTVDIAGTITANCSGNIPTFTIGIDAGTGSGATVNNRIMTGPGGASLGYYLFRNAARTMNTGATRRGSIRYPALAPGGLQILQSTPGFFNQFPAPGSYVDTVLNIHVIASEGTTATAKFSVAATIVNACNISATNLAFGTYTGTLTNSASTISVLCTNSTGYNVGLDAGKGSGATVAKRRMTGPGGTSLTYELFRNLGRTLNWGNTVGTDTVAGTGSGSVQAIMVYGQIPAGQNDGAPGNYTDTITATITY